MVPIALLLPGLNLSNFAFAYLIPRILNLKNAAAITKRCIATDFHSFIIEVKVDRCNPTIGKLFFKQL